MDEESKMIAPCGLDCSLCVAALRKEEPCPGCWGEGGGKSEHCAKLCKIKFCPEREKLSDGYCSQCSRYPCEYLLALEDKYQHQWPLKESPVGNLELIKKVGMAEFLRQEAEQWRCPECGKIICVHTGTCSGGCQNE